ncbi:uncharacterized protein LOC115444601 [Manduca sexta]|nr:uncharacterized protein LOC115444601 [Manduca sexta]
MFRHNILLSVVLIVCATVVIAQSPVSRCFQYTWLGPRFNNESIFLNATCQDATRLASGVPCVHPLVASYDGTWPDVDYIWRNYEQNASCILASNDVCATYTYYFNGHAENSTSMCTRAVNRLGNAITSGCYTQRNGSYVTTACFCRSVPGGVPCNDAYSHFLSAGIIFFLAVLMFKNFNVEYIMYSVLTRGNAILTYTLSVLACLTFLCFLSTLTVDYRTAAQMNTVKVVVKNVPDYGASRERNDLGFLTFDLKTDLSHLFNWNVKQLFLYLTAEYITPNNELNQVVLWDKIILRGENALLDFKNMNTKYYFWDDGNGLKAHNNVTLTLSWNIIPNAGLLPNIQAIGQHSFKFPTDYTQTRV